jgi:DNA-directed RNA polymerase subunit RPC12/RpoP
LAKGRCVTCRKEIGFWGTYIVEGKKYCSKCFYKARSELFKKMEEGRYIPKIGEIKCQYCGKYFFKGPTVKPPSILEDTAKGAIFFPWGVSSSIKNKPYVQCPWCNMKIVQD